MKMNIVIVAASGRGRRAVPALRGAGEERRGLRGELAYAMLCYTVLY